MSLARLWEPRAGPPPRANQRFLREEDGELRSLRLAFLPAFSDTQSTDVNPLSGVNPSTSGTSAGTVITW